MDKTSIRGENRRFKAFFLLFILCLSFYVLTMNNRFSSAQTIEMYVFVQNLVENHTFGLDHVQNLSQEGLDGRQYCKQGLGYLISYVPFYILSEHLGMKWILYMVTPLATALSAAFLFLIGLELKYQRKTSIALAVAYGLGTMVWAYAKLQFPQPLATVFITITLYLIIRYKNTKEKLLLLGAGASSGYAIWIRAEMAPFAFFVFLYSIYSNLDERSWSGFKRAVPRLSREASYFLMTFLFLLFILFYYNYVRFGSFWETGYTMGREGLAGRKLSSMDDVMELLKGLLAFWLLPNQSLFVSSPILIFSLFALRRFWRKYKPEFALFLGSFVLYSIFYSLNGFSGFGTPTWGMRYASPWVSLFLLPMGMYIDGLWKPERAKKRKVFFAVLFVSFAFQIVGTITNYQTIQMPITKTKDNWWTGRTQLASQPKYALLLTHLLAVKYGHGYAERVTKLPPGYNYLVDYYLIQNETGHPRWGIILLLLTMIAGSGYFLWNESKALVAPIQKKEHRKSGRKREVQKKKNPA